MNKKTIITILLALAAMAGQAQTFTPVVEDSIDFVITGTTTSNNDSVATFPCAPHGQSVKFPIQDGQPEWDGYEFEYFKNYPSVQWKLLNLKKLAKQNPQKLLDELEKLKNLFYK